MAMEISSNFPDFSVKEQNYSSSAANSSAASSSAASSTKMKETEKTSETTGRSKSKNTTDYVRELAKLVPSVELKVGNTFSTAKSGKTLTINPQLLEKMQNDPEQEKEMKELIKGVESAVSMLDSVCNASGWTVVFKHCYIDENGKFRSIAYLRNDFMLNMSDKLREERRKNSEKLLEKQKEKAAEKKEELAEMLEEKETAKAEEEPEKESEKESAYDKAEQLLEEKIAASKDGMIYLYDTDLKTIAEAAREDNAGKTDTKEKAQIGANLDLQA